MDLWREREKERVPEEKKNLPPPSLMTAGFHLSSFAVTPQLTPNNYERREREEEEEEE